MCVRAFPPLGARKFAFFFPSPSEKVRRPWRLLPLIYRRFYFVAPPLRKRVPFLQSLGSFFSSLRTQAFIEQETGLSFSSDFLPIVRLPASTPTVSSVPQSVSWASLPYSGGRGRLLPSEIEEGSPSPSLRVWSLRLLLSELFFFLFPSPTVFFAPFFLT